MSNTATTTNPGITLDRLPPAPEAQSMGDYKSVGQRVQQYGHTEETLKTVRLADLEFIRAVIMAEAAEWIGDRRTSVWSALIIIAKKSGITITRQQCEAAARAKYPGATL